MAIRVRYIAAVVCLLILTTSTARASESVTVAWDPSPDKAVTGYRVYYGTAPFDYRTVVDVGPATSYTTPVLPVGTYYMAVRAYAADGLSSGFSNELTVVVQPVTITPRERARTDFNLDGRADLLWRNRSTGELAVWALDGSSLRVEAGLSHSMPDVNWEVAGVGDFNSDASPDLLWHHKTLGFVAVWYMSGLSNFGVVSLSTPRVADTAWKIAGVGDVSGDGKPDIVWQHDTGPVALWRMDGVTNLLGSALMGDPAMAYDSRWRVVSVSDMNGDGQVDLLWQHTNGQLSTWLMYAGNVYGVQSLNPLSEPDTAWRVVGTIDANADGKTDIVWQHTDGRVRLWLMDGLSRTSSVDISGGSLGGVNWRIVGPR